jgi:hypothetical protein
VDVCTSADCAITAGRGSRGIEDYYPAAPVSNGSSVEVGCGPQAGADCHQTNHYEVQGAEPSLAQHR